MRAVSLTIVVIVLSSLGALASADTLELRDGTLVNGKYEGGTATTVRIATGEGTRVIETSQIVALTFTGSAATQPSGATAAAAAASAVPAAAQVAQPVAVTVPSGTVLAIRLDSQVSSKDKEGTKFTGKLLGDLLAGDKTVAKAGSTVHGEVDKSKQARRMTGKSELEISLTGIDVSGSIVPIATTNFSEKGKSSFRKTARNTAGGALIGEVVDDDGGAAAGAAIGAGISLIRKGDSVTAPAGMLLEFRLTQPVQVNAK